MYICEQLHFSLKMKYQNYLNYQHSKLIINLRLVQRSWERSEWIYYQFHFVFINEISSTVLNSGGGHPPPRKIWDIINSQEVHPLDVTMCPPPISLSEFQKTLLKKIVWIQYWLSSLSEHIFHLFVKASCQEELRKQLINLLK